MVSPALTTIVKTIEDLPEERLNQLADHLREYLADMEDDEKWDETFARTQDKLTYATREAERQIAEGKSEPMVESYLGMFANDADMVDEVTADAMRTRESTMPRTHD
ncbi:MAG: hypothetical protein A3K41_10395 [Chloroflexi bacterium RIFOXYD12_FULL_57_15]|nr:MAG: hypothetical protein A3K41_10395 [Chloroflexi bacterium RIFOXYD12_FULL_57_15]